MKSLDLMLESFWKWCGINKETYANIPDPTTSIEPFYFPSFDCLMNLCRQRINSNMSDQEVDDFLTCLALDSEDEQLLSWCIREASDDFLDNITQRGCNHIQPEARWQIAELLGRRSIPNGEKYLEILCNDPNDYVRKRAGNALTTYHS